MFKGGHGVNVDATIVAIVATNWPVCFNPTPNCRPTPVDARINAGAIDTGFCVVAVAVGLAEILGRVAVNCCGYNTI